MYDGTAYRKKNNYDQAITNLEEAYRTSTMESLKVSFPVSAYLIYLFPKEAIRNKERNELFKEILRLEDIVLEIKQEALLHKYDNKLYFPRVGYFLQIRWYFHLIELFP